MTIASSNGYTMVWLAFTSILGEFPESIWSRYSTTATAVHNYAVSSGTSGFKSFFATAGGATPDKN